MRKYNYASKNPSVTATARSPKEPLNAGFKSLFIVSYKTKKDDIKSSFLFWCEKRDLNPYEQITSPSNVRVCQFRHSRIFYCAVSQPCLTIILKCFAFVNTFFENILLFLIKFKNNWQMNENEKKLKEKPPEKSGGYVNISQLKLKFCFR